MDAKTHEAQSPWSGFIVLWSHVAQQLRSHIFGKAPARKRTRGGTSGSNRGPAPRTRGGTEAHKGRNRWFQQRPRNKDQGASAHCENFTKASGTDEIANQSPPPPLFVRLLVAARAWEGGVSGQGSSMNFVRYGIFSKPSQIFDRNISDFVCNHAHTIFGTQVSAKVNWKKFGLPERICIKKLVKKRCFLGNKKTHEKWFLSSQTHQKFLVILTTQNFQGSYRSIPFGGI